MTNLNNCFDWLLQNDVSKSSLFNILPDGTSLVHNFCCDARKLQVFATRLVFFFCNLPPFSPTQFFPEKWPEICHIGMRQSPINLDFTTAIEHTIPPFKFVNYDEKYRFVINSDGQTGRFGLYSKCSRCSTWRTPWTLWVYVNREKFSVKFKIKSPHTIKIKGGGLPYEYVLDSITFHNSAEHTINLYR